MARQGVVSVRVMRTFTQFGLILFYVGELVLFLELTTFCCNLRAFFVLVIRTVKGIGM